MTDPTSTRRFSPTPAWLIFGLLVVEGLLWLSERYRWFWFNEKKGWTVLIAVAGVGGAMLVMLLWFIVALVLRWRFQFGIRSLLVLVVAVAVPCSWLAVEMKAAREQKEAVAAIKSLEGAIVFYESQVDADGNPLLNPQPSGPAWLSSLLGDEFFGAVAEVDFVSGKITDGWLEHVNGLTQLQQLHLDGAQITDADLEFLRSLSNVKSLTLLGTRVTDKAVLKFQQALPSCQIMGPLRSHQGDGTFQDISWRHPALRSPVRGYQVCFPEFNLGNDYQAVFNVANLPDIQRDVGIYLLLSDPDGKLEKDEMRRLEEMVRQRDRQGLASSQYEFKYGLSALWLFELRDSKGNLVTRVEKPLSELTWSTPSRQKGYGIYAFAFPRDGRCSFFHACKGECYTLRVKYRPDPRLGPYRGRIYLQSGGTI